MYSLSPSLWPRLPLFCVLNIQQLEFHRITLLTRFVLFVFVCLKMVHFLLFVVWVGLSFSFVAPSLAVFWGASAFNQDVSKWNTGAVTTMQNSKCTLSPSLRPRLPLLRVFHIQQLEFHRITLLTRFVIFVLVFLKRYSFVVVCGGLVFPFLCCTLLSCSVS